jgi:hypothetical protein
MANMPSSRSTIISGVAGTGVVMVELERTAREQIPRIFPASARRVSESFRLETSRSASGADPKRL